MPRLSQPQDEEIGESNGNQIFADGHEGIFDMQFVHDLPPDFVTDERSDYTACCTQDRASK